MSSYAAQTVVSLRALLSSRGFEQTGLKAALTMRLEGEDSVKVDSVKSDGT